MNNYDLWIIAELLNTIAGATGAWTAADVAALLFNTTGLNLENTQLNVADRLTTDGASVAKWMQLCFGELGTISTLVRNVAGTNANVNGITAIVETVGTPFISLAQIQTDVDAWYAANPGNRVISTAAMFMPKSESFDVLPRVFTYITYQLGVA
jgi:hypothetical protein